MKLKTFGVYPDNWKDIARTIKGAAGRCVRCLHEHDPKTGYCLTVHHWDGNKANCVWWNCIALCQRCHLSVQGRVNPERPWIFVHSGWFKPYVAGFYAKKYLGEDLTVEDVAQRLPELLALEAQAVLGCDPIEMGV